MALAAEEEEKPVRKSPIPNASATAKMAQARPRNSKFLEIIFEEEEDEYNATRTHRVEDVGNNACSQDPTGDFSPPLIPPPQMEMIPNSSDVLGQMAFHAILSDTTADVISAHLAMPDLADLCEEQRSDTSGNDEGNTGPIHGNTMANELTASDHDCSIPSPDQDQDLSTESEISSIGKGFGEESIASTLSRTVGNNVSTSTLPLQSKDLIRDQMDKLEISSIGSGFEEETIDSILQRTPGNNISTSDPPLRPKALDQYQSWDSETSNIGSGFDAENISAILDRTTKNASPASDLTSYSESSGHSQKTHLNLDKGVVDKLAESILTRMPEEASSSAAPGPPPKPPRRPSLHREDSAVLGAPSQTTIVVADGNGSRDAVPEASSQNRILIADGSGSREAVLPQVIANFETPNVPIMMELPRLRILRLNDCSADSRSHPRLTKHPKRVNTVCLPSGLRNQIMPLCEEVEETVRKSFTILLKLLTH